MRHSGPTVVDVTRRRAVYLRVRAGLARQNLFLPQIYSPTSPRSGLIDMSTIPQVSGDESIDSQLDRW